MIPPNFNQYSIGNSTPMHPTKRNRTFTKKFGFPVILATSQNKDERKQMIDIVIKIVFMCYRGLIVCVCDAMYLLVSFAMSF